MTDRNFSRPGAVDLSQVAAQAASSTGGSYVQEVDEASLETVIRKSVQHPVILELYSPRANAQAMSDALIQAATDDAGKWLLARVNVDTQPRIAQAMGVQAVPTVIAVIGGQAMPLFQGTKSAAEIRAYVDQVVKAAVANGIVGRAEPVSSPAAGAEAEGADAAADPRFDAADAAIERGDFAAAVAEYDKLLAANPADAEAKAGRAHVALLDRVSKLDPVATQIKAGQVDDVAAQLEVADLEMAQNNPEAAFARLIELIRVTAGADRDQARERLLELFEVVGQSDPRVNKARRALATALF